MKSLFRICVVLGLLGTMVLGCRPIAAAEKRQDLGKAPSAKVQRYIRLAEARRPVVIRRLTIEFNQRSRLLRKLSRGKLRNNTLQRLRVIRDELQNLQDGKTLPVPVIKWNSLAVGLIGRLDYVHTYKVLQILNKKEMLIRHIYPPRVIFLVRGVATDGIIDDAQFATTSHAIRVFEITTTEKYTTAAGSSNTVFVLEPFDLKPVVAWLDMQEAARAKLAKPAPQQRDNEKTAAAKLRTAKLLRNTNPAACKKRLEDLIKKYPTTKAAVDARKLLAEISQWKT